MEKSLFAKLLCIKAHKAGLPVIIVDRFIPGIHRYLESIEQEVVVLFDEFDKTFGNIKTGNNEANPQAGMLSLFDGISGGKKLFVITCNELQNINDFLVNRPGRFHYHFQFSYPTDAEIREYLMDFLDEAYYDQIDAVISFSKRIDLNYDCLRAIAFELNSGETFDKAIEDLNIINVEGEKYSLTLRFNDGTVMNNKEYYLDLFSGETEDNIEMYNREGYNTIDIKFDTTDCIYDPGLGQTIVPGNHVEITYCNDEDSEAKRLKDVGIAFLTIIRKRNRGIHYAV